MAADWADPSECETAAEMDDSMAERSADHWGDKRAADWAGY